jgi:hypothetical protein
MKAPKPSARFAFIALLALGAFTACESTDSGGTQVTSNVYYGVGFYDPWYYGDYDYDGDVVVTPPSPGSPPVDRPPSIQDPHPSHPIAQPPRESPRPPAASPRPPAQPMPSIPSTPRPTPRAGGGRR